MKLRAERTTSSPRATGPKMKPIGRRKNEGEGRHWSWRGDGFLLRSDGFISATGGQPLRLQRPQTSGNRLVEESFVRFVRLSKFPVLADPMERGGP